MTLNHLFIFGLLFTLANSGLTASTIQVKAKSPSVVQRVKGDLYHTLRFAACASLGFFALGQSSYHLGNLITDCWFDNKFRDTAGHKQAIRFAVGMVGTTVLLLTAKCLDQLGDHSLDQNVAELEETEDTVDGTPQAKKRYVPNWAEAL